MKRLIFFLFISLALFLTTSCDVTRSRYRTPGEQASAMLQLGIQNDEKLYEEEQKAQLPIDIKKTLVPGTDPQNKQNQKFSDMYGKKFDVNVSNISADLFFKNLAKATPYSIVVDPQVTGFVTLTLKDVTITEILDALRDMNGYDYRQTSYGFEVLPAKIQTQTFHVNYLDVNRGSNSFTQISADELINVVPSTTTGDVSNNASTSSSGSGSGNNAPPGASRSQVNTTAQINFWSELTTSLNALIGTGGGRSIVVNPASGTIVIKAFPNELREVSNFLGQVQSNMSREVILEVKLLEISLNDAFSSGINWSILGFSQLNNSASAPPTASNSSGGATQLTTINVHGTNFTSIMSLLEQQGSVQTIANPRVLTINNQQAVIRIGTDQFFVTGVTTNINNGVSTTGGTVTTASVGLTPFFSGVILDITPQISDNGDILLHLHPVVSNVTPVNQSIDIGASSPMVLPLAVNNIREYDSIVRAEDGQIVLIGGLTQNTVQETVQGTPGVSRIPFFGSLFRNTDQSSKKVELVILLKPTILGRGQRTMVQQLPLEAERINQLDRGFHVGSMPEMFGNEAEIPAYDREVGQ